MPERFNPDAVRLARRARGMSQVELATALGVSQVSVSHWEKGRRVPEPGVLGGLATVLGVLPLTLEDSSVATTTPKFRASGVTAKRLGSSINREAARTIRA